MERRFYHNSDGHRLVTKQDLDEALAQSIAPLATKVELSTLKHELQLEIRGLEVKMEKGFADILKWMVTAMIAISSLTVAIMKLF